MKALQRFLDCLAVPSEYRDLYRKLDYRIDGFAETVGAQWNGVKAPVAFSSELLSANANSGMALLDPDNARVNDLELDALRAMGCGAVSIALNYPIVYQPFHDFNGTSGACRQFIDYYCGLVQKAHDRGMKVVVDHAIVFTGYYGAGSGLNVNGYYRTIENGRDLARQRAETALTVARQIGPDYLNLGSEPDTQAGILGIPELAEPYHYGDFIKTLVDALHGAGVTIPLGAGCGTWAGEAEAYVDWLCRAGVDIIDFHLYPVNLHFLECLPALAARVRSFGKAVAIGEAWLMKERVCEFSGENTASNPVIFARDPMSFWAPLDQRFLCALVDFAHWQRCAYFSSFWTRYFWAYLDYADCEEMTADEINKAAGKAAGQALVRGETTDTAGAYRDAIAP